MIRNSLSSGRTGPCWFVVIPGSPFCSPILSGGKGDRLLFWLSATGKPCGQQAGCAYHIINRGNGRGEVFHKSQDYEAFLSLLATAKARHPVKLFGFCLMPNHCHFERKVACPFMI